MGQVGSGCPGVLEQGVFRLLVVRALIKAIQMTRNEWLEWGGW